MEVSKDVKAAVVGILLSCDEFETRSGQQFNREISIETKNTHLRHDAAEDCDG